MSVYMIKCKTSEDCYIGSTVNIKRRLKEHKYRSKNDTNPLYQFIRNNGCWDNFEFSILEENCIKLKETEQAYIETIESTLNTNRASIDYKTHLALGLIHSKKWRLNNPDIVKKYKDKYNKWTLTCECGEENVNRNHMSRHRSSYRHKKKVAEKVAELTTDENLSSS